MELLELPLDLLELIVHFLVKDVGPVKAFETGFACRAFSAVVLDNILNRQPIDSLFFNAGVGATRLFQDQGADMIFTRSPKSAVAFTAVAGQISDKLVEFMQHRGQSRCKPNVRDIYKAMAAIEPPWNMINILVGESDLNKLSDNELDQILPAAAAATGELETFKILICGGGSAFDDGHWEAFPSAVVAAAAAGKTEILQWILGISWSADAGVVSDCDYSPSHMNSCVRHLKSHNRGSIFSALHATIGHYQYEAGCTILDFLFSDACWMKPDAKFHFAWATGVMEECLKYANFQIYQELLQRRRNGFESAVANLEAKNGIALTSLDLSNIFSSASGSMLGKMLHAGLFHPDKIGIHIPLVLAVNRSRYNLIRTLLAHGADVNARDAHGVPALQLVVNTGFIHGFTGGFIGGVVPHVQLLIENGADPSLVVTSDDESGSICVELCKKATIKIHQMAESQPGCNLDVEAWRKIWYEWKDSSLLKKTWDMYRDVVKKMG